MATNFTGIFFIWIRMFNQDHSCCRKLKLFGLEDSLNILRNRLHCIGFYEESVGFEGGIMCVLD